MSNTKLGHLKLITGIVKLNSPLSPRFRAILLRRFFTKDVESVLIVPVDLGFRCVFVYIHSDETETKVEESRVVLGNDNHSQLGRIT